jgi:hypothetical protein
MRVLRVTGELFRYGAVMRDSLQLCAVVFLENGPLAIEVVHKRLLDMGGFRTPHMSRTKLPDRCRLASSLNVPSQRGLHACRSTLTVQ